MCPSRPQCCPTDARGRLMLLINTTPQNGRWHDGSVLCNVGRSLLLSTAVLIFNHGHLLRHESIFFRVYVCSQYTYAAQIMQIVILWTISLHREADSRATCYRYILLACTSYSWPGTVLPHLFVFVMLENVLQISSWNTMAPGSCH